MIESIRKLFRLLAPKERRHMYYLFVAMFFMAIMEVVGVTSVIPFMAVVSNPGLIEQNSALSWFYTFFGFGSYNAFLVFLGSSVLVALLLSNSVSAIVTWALLKFSYMRNHSLSRRMLINYVNRPYTFFLNRNSSELTKNVLSEVQMVVDGVLVNLMQVMAKTTVIIFLITTLFIAKPLATFAMCALLVGAYSLIYIIAKRKLERIGRIRVIANKHRYGATAEIFGGIKDIKLLAKENYFINRFEVSSKKLWSCFATTKIIARLPRYALEAFVFGGIMAVVLYVLVLQEGTSSVLPLIALYILAGYRIMPAIQQVFMSAAQLKFNLSAIDVLYDDMKYSQSACFAAEQASCPPFEQAFEFNHVLSVNNVSFKYPGSDFYAVKNINIDITKNKTVAFVGATGSGKTTLADIILGYLKPSDGCILVDDVMLGDEEMKLWRRKLGYVSQHIYLSDDSIKRNIAFGVDDNDIDINRVEQSARIANIHDYIVNLDEGYDTYVGERGVRVSGGERQRIGIARALYNNPDVIVMDEATSALDNITENAVMTAIENLSHKKTLILIAHRLTTVRSCDTIHMLEKGKIVGSGTYDELLEKNMHFQNMAMNSLANGDLARDTLV